MLSILFLCRKTILPMLGVLLTFLPGIAHTSISPRLEENYAVPDSYERHRALVSLSDRIAEMYLPSLDGVELRIHDSSATITLEPGSEIDIEVGNGHGFYLAFTHMVLLERSVDIEVVRWHDGLSSIQRQLVDPRAVKPILHMIAILPALVLEEVNYNGPEPILGSWGSSADFFVLVRIMDREGNVRFEREYAGYHNSSNQLAYLPLQAVCLQTSELLETIGQWREVPHADLRTSHFPDAYNRNRDIMIQSFHWWVMEYSTKALDCLGTLDVLPTIQYLRDNYPDLLERQRDLLDDILTHPASWLLGEPTP